MLMNYCYDDNNVSAERLDKRRLLRQHVYAALEFRKGTMSNSYLILFNIKLDNQIVFSIAKCTVLLQLLNKIDSYSRKLAFVRYMHAVPPAD